VFELCGQAPARPPQRPLETARGYCNACLVLSAWMEWNLWDAELAMITLSTSVIAGCTAASIQPGIHPTPHITSTTPLTPSAGCCDASTRHARALPSRVRQRLRDQVHCISTSGLCRRCLVCSSLLLLRPSLCLPLQVLGRLMLLFASLCRRLDAFWASQIRVLSLLLLSRGKLQAN